MPFYDYQSDAGDRLEVFRSMRDEHPETIEQEGKTFRRVYGGGKPPAVKVKEYAIKHGHEPLPVSVGMPLRDTSQGTPGTMNGHDVVHYPDGGTTDSRGRWIIDGKEARDRAKSITGLREE